MFLSDRNVNTVHLWTIQYMCTTRDANSAPLKKGNNMGVPAASCDLKANLKIVRFFQDGIK